MQENSSTPAPLCFRRERDQRCSQSATSEELLLCHLHEHCLRYLRIQRLALTPSQRVEHQRTSQLRQVHGAHLSIVARSGNKDVAAARRSVPTELRRGHCRYFPVFGVN